MKISICPLKYYENSRFIFEKRGAKYIIIKEKIKDNNVDIFYFIFFFYL
jgi:hypothetical protein